MVQQVVQTAVGLTGNLGSDFFQKFRASFSKSEKATQIDIEARDIEEEMAIIEAMRSAKPVNMVYQYGRNGTFFSPLRIDTLGFVSYQDYLKEDSYSLSYTQEVSKRYNRDYSHSPIRVFNTRYVWSDRNFEEDNTDAPPRIAHAGGGRGELITDVHLLQTTKNSGRNWRTITTSDVLIDYSSVQNTTEGRRRLPYRSEGHIAGLANTSTAAVRTKSTAKWYDVSGKKISSLMNLQNNLSLWNKAIDPEARFEQGTKAYILNKEAASSSLNYEKQSSEGTVKSGEPISVLRPIFVANIYHPIQSRYVNTYRFQRINSPNLQPRNLTTAANDQLRDLLIIGGDDVNYTAAFFRVNYVYQFDRWNQPGVVEVFLIPKNPNYTVTFADTGEGRYALSAYRFGGTYDDNFAYPENYWDTRMVGTTEVLTFNLNIGALRNSTSKRQGLFNYNGRLILGTDFQIVNRGDRIEIDQFNLDSAGHQAVLNAIIPNRIEEQVEDRENLK